MLTAAGSATAPADAHTALQLFKLCAGGNIFLMAGAPVVLAPAVTELFGARDATAIYQRIGAVITIASPVGATLVTTMRDHAYLREATVLASACDEQAFLAAFGDTSANIASLVKTNTATLPLLLHIAPEGTPDPTPLLYNDAFYALAASSAIACACNVCAFQVLSPPVKRS